MASIYKRGRVWQIKFRFNNQSIQKSLKTRNKSRALYVKKIVENYVNDGMFPDVEEILTAPIDDRVEIEEFLSRIEREIKNNISLSKSYRKRLSDFLKNFRKFLAREKIRYIDRISPQTAIRYRNWRLNTPAQKTDRTISPKTVRDELIFLKNQVFERAVDEELIDKNPFKNATKNLRVYQREKEPFTSEEIYSLIEHAPNQLHRDIYTLLYLTGCRIGELFHLEWCDVDFDQNIIYVRNKESHPTKTRRTRIIPMHELAKSILLRRKSESESNYVFPSPNDPNLPLKSIRTGFNNLKRKLGISENKSLHSFRHTFATNLIKANVPIEVSKEILGHTDIKMTTAYQHVGIDIMKKAVEKLEIRTLDNKGS